jgi:type II secretory pathway component PulF
LNLHALQVRRLLAARAAEQPLGAVARALDLPAGVGEALDAGEPLADALARHDALPLAYIEALRAGDGAAAALLAERAAEMDLRRRRFRAVVLAALGHTALLVVALALGVALGLRPLEQVFADMQADVSSWWQTLYRMLNGAFSGRGVALIAVVLIASALGVDRLWQRTGEARRGWRSAATAGLAALLEAGVSAERALEALAAYAPGWTGVLRGAAAAVRDGRPVGEALRDAGLAPEGLGELWLLADGAGQPLAPLARALAEADEAERAAQAPGLGQGAWLLQAAISGVFVLGLGLALVSAWVWLLPWPGSS